jgi:hypothetical protein
MKKIDINKKLGITREAEVLGYMMALITIVIVKAKRTNTTTKQINPTVETTKNNL